MLGRVGGSSFRSSWFASPSIEPPLCKLGQWWFHTHAELVVHDWVLGGRRKPLSSSQLHLPEHSLSNMYLGQDEKCWCHTSLRKMVLHLGARKLMCPLSLAVLVWSRVSFLIGFAFYLWVGKKERVSSLGSNASDYISFLLIDLLFLAVLGLRCFVVWTFSSCSEWGLLSYGVWASCCSGFSCCRAWAVEHVSFSSCDAGA